ncbi:STY0301 family protein [Massilia sp. BJB1822]|uniref:STY0301 family protein n=1 Tax=Massilia sp. BJB1822 TaxID=2744470 RepID=UPI001592B6D2|nr:STY0301 family protein [Massilia sp. BJB1822]NVD97536.1 hypothetical protein [Massilia sp. BJB1822]
MHKISHCLIIPAALALFAPASSAEILNCPAQIQTHPKASEVAGWEMLAEPAQHYFENAGIYSGHPREQASLVPDEQVSGKKLTARWSLPPDGPHAYWLGCSYRNTTVMAVRQLDSRYRSCRIEYAKRRGTGLEVKQIECS